jgi:hypothetical protein
MKEERGIEIRETKQKQKSYLSVPCKQSVVRVYGNGGIGTKIFSSKTKDEKCRNTARAFDIRLYLTPLSQARQLKETCGT